VGVHRQPAALRPGVGYAQAGDTLRFANFSKVATEGGGWSVNCQMDPEDVPLDWQRVTEVIAATERVVIAVDLFRSDVADFLTDDARERFQAAAETVDPLLIPTMKEVYGHNFEPLAGVLLVVP
jgi:hypothetical protein